MFSKLGSDYVRDLYVRHKNAITGYVVGLFFFRSSDNKAGRKLDEH